MKTKRKYSEMTVGELGITTEAFEEDLVVEKSRSLTPAEQQLWRQAKRKRGRPRMGEGFQRISVSMERGLLERVTAMARERHVPRSLLLAQAVEALLAREEG
ncbi:MAG: ribbon-helix-helix protein, CopG family [Candidatus Riflebacteria bacterium]|nr:ribbon-helix-helix protein, CopG family [Candidatus Riflebacteria bacterium]